MSLRDQAVELALVSLADGDMLPFVLATKLDGTLRHSVVVSESSDKAHDAARLVVRQHANDTTEYAIVVDTYVRVDGERYDALLVEFGGREGAHVLAYRYTRVDGHAKLVGDPIDFEWRPSALAPLDPFALDWGGITPDLYNEEQNHAVHVVNHALGDPANVERTIRFLRARIRHFVRHLPANARQSVFVEDRGAPVGTLTRRNLAGGVGHDIEVRYISEMR